MTEACSQQQVCPLSETCAFEQEYQGPGSPGPIAGEEKIARAAFSPIHFSNAGLLKVAFIRKSDIESGTLSVWRLNYLDVAPPEGLNAHFEAQKHQDHTLDSVYAPPASVIRQILFASEHRCHCVFDDTKTGAGEDDIHPAHAAIRICANSEGWTLDEVELVAIRETLKNTFRDYKIEPSE